MSMTAKYGHRTHIRRILMEVAGVVYDKSPCRGRAEAVSAVKREYSQE